jgi:hypothetical protein
MSLLTLVVDLTFICTYFRFVLCCVIRFNFSFDLLLVSREINCMRHKKLIHVQFFLELFRLFLDGCVGLYVAISSHGQNYLQILAPWWNNLCACWLPLQIGHNGHDRWLHMCNLCLWITVGAWGNIVPLSMMTILLMTSSQASWLECNFLVTWWK